MWKVAWYFTGVGLVGLLLWTAYLTVIGDFDVPAAGKAQTRVLVQ